MIVATESWTFERELGVRPLPLSDIGSLDGLSVGFGLANRGYRVKVGYRTDKVDENITPTSTISDGAT